jgi:hypothetical protein
MDGGGRVMDPFVDQLAALCRAHVRRAKWVFVPSHGVGHTIGERIALARSVRGRNGQASAATLPSRQVIGRRRARRAAAGTGAP